MIFSLKITSRFTAFLKIKKNKIVILTLKIIAFLTFENKEICEVISPLIVF